MKYPPRPRTGVLVLLAYLAVFYGIWTINGVEYDNIGDSADTLLKWYVAPLAGGAVVLVIATSVLGWWRPALFEVKRSAPRWLIVGPVFMALGALVILLSKDTSETTARMVWLLIAGSLLVGFCEEMATRGVLIVGFRGAYSEPKVWFVSTLLFGLMHLPNAMFGAGPAAIAQVFLAFMGGTMLYLARRTSGTLLLAMFIHGFWDFSNFIGEGGEVASGLVFVNGILALVLVWVLLRHEKQQHLPQAGVAIQMPAADPESAAALQNAAALENAADLDGR